MPQHLIVGNPQHRHSLRAQERIAFLILLARSYMRLTIDLHPKPLRRAVEVHYVPPDNVLPPELESAELRLTQAIPQRPLGLSRIASKNGGSF